MDIEVNISFECWHKVSHAGQRLRSKRLFKLACVHPGVYIHSNTRTHMNPHVQAIAQKGIARFERLRIDVAGTEYRLVFNRRSGGFLPAVSDPFDVLPGTCELYTCACVRS
jgi:hypothetical protein